MSRVQIAVVSILVTALGLFTATAPSPAAAASPECSQLLLLFARGTGQGADAAEMNAFLSRVRSHTPDGLAIAEYKLGLQGKYRGERYPAKGAWSFGTLYGGSVQNGIDEMRLLLRDRARECKGEVWILAGYSQGAQVVGTAIQELTAAERTNIGYVALFGDPKFMPGTTKECGSPSWWVRGSAICGQSGLLTRGVSSARPTYATGDLRGRFGSWCDGNDGVCATGLTGNLPGSGSTHFGYADSAAGEAALEAVIAVHTRLGSPNPVRSLDLARGSAGVDMMVVFDTTGSMYDEIDEMRANAQTIANQVLSKPNGRIGLVQFRDHGDEFVARMETDLTFDAAAFSAALDRLEAADGGDEPEAQYSGIMTALDGASWRTGSTRTIVVITDAPGKDPEEVTGYTRQSVVQRAFAPLGQDVPVTFEHSRERRSHQATGPALQGGQAVAIFGIDVLGTPATSDFLAPLASDTGGSVLGSGSDLAAAFSSVVQRAAARPVVRLPAGHFGRPGRAVIFSAAGSFDPDSTITAYRWDLDGDGAFEIATTSPIASRVFAAPTEVRIGVAAVSADGGVGTAVSRVVVARNALGALRPKAVRKLKIRRVGPRVARLTWAAPRGGVAPAAYLVLDAKGRPLKTIRVATKPRPLVATLTRLPRGTRLTFSVVATERFGDGPKRTVRIRLPRAT
jgi:hypothetical protein